MNFKTAKELLSLCEAEQRTISQAMQNATVAGAVGGLAEYPCQNRNAAGAANALIAMEMTMAGIRQLIPLDEMMTTMYNVGKRIPAELWEMALAGCAVSPSACSRCAVSGI